MPGSKVPGQETPECTTVYCFVLYFLTARNKGHKGLSREGNVIQKESWKKRLDWPLNHLGVLRALTWREMLLDQSWHSENLCADEVPHPAAGIDSLSVHRPGWPRKQLAQRWAASCSLHVSWSSVLGAACRQHPGHDTCHLPATPSPVGNSNGHKQTGIRLDR